MSEASDLGDLTIGEDPGTGEQTAAPVRALVTRMHRQKPYELGFPTNLAFDLSDAGILLSTLTNNAGDPAHSDTADISTKPMERAVIAWFTELAGGDPDGTYGYVTGSGSEGILFGLHTGRRRLPRAPLYASAEAHYSVRKAAGLLRMELVEVACRADGGMDPDALYAACRTRRRRDALTGRRPRGAVVVATVGTTMRGAVDDLPALRAASAPAGPVHVHSDAALGGLLAAFSPARPAWGLGQGADSLSVSGHKLVGCPVPCGVVLTPDRYVSPVPVGAYLGTDDHTLGCSRSGLAAALLWMRLRRLGTSGVRDLVHRCRRTAVYARTALERAGARPERLPEAIAVTFDRPPRDVVDRWHLATQGDRAHLVAMPHVTPEAVDALCRDLTAASR
ncbi:pyridoxal-dependent decarboxylase [Streptomyces sp. CRN 30]|uniref:pyridoxal-dependent decarboxylase n=1 Tax=Streptomyces sp. CRN 30 TaxID=3075613 RepID=UPI002A7FFEAA|nr:pyridoxal-dependent decarboxylase [Streptomyces sp. CRN 30]